MDCDTSLSPNFARSGGACEIVRSHLVDALS